MKIKYKFLQGYSTIKALENSVNECLSDGWQLQGGIFYERWTGLGMSAGFYYSQTLVKYV